MKKLVIGLSLLLGTGASAQKELLEPARRAGSWSESSAREFLTALLADGKFSTEEQALLSDVAAGKVQPVPEGRAAELINLMAHPGNLNTLWDGSWKEMRLLVDMSRLGPVPRERVLKFIVSKATAAWQVCRMDRAKIDPIVALVTMAHTKLAAADPETREVGKKLFREAFERVRNSAGETIPPFVFVLFKE